MNSGSETRRSRAQERFATFLEEFYASGASIDALCERHPEDADYFRTRWQQLIEIGEITPMDTPPADTGEEDRIGPFALVREIGRGGMGIVYEAQDPTLDRRVAIKVLPANRRVFGSAKQRFEREIRALARLDHPSVVRIYEADLTSEPPHIVMEFIRGLPLGAYWNDEHVSQSEDRFRTIARLMAETAEALEHAHQNGVLHRDVKPGNILVDENRRARLLDFGVARMVGEEDLTATGGFAGTAAYASPEQISSSFGQVDARTDVYALGVVLYELLVGRLPFHADDTAEVFRRILDEHPKEPQHIDARVPWELSTIAIKALEKQPKGRYSTAAAIAADLRAFENGLPIVAQPPTKWHRFRRYLHNHPSLRGIAVLLFVAVFAAAATLVTKSIAAEREERDQAQDLLKRQLPGVLREVKDDFVALKELSMSVADLEDTNLRGGWTDKQRAQWRKRKQERNEQRSAITKKIEWFEVNADHVDRVLGEKTTEVLRIRLEHARLRYFHAVGNLDMVAHVMARLEWRHAGHPEVAAGSQFSVSIRVNGAELYLFRYATEPTAMGPRHRLFPHPANTGGMLAWPEMADWKPGTALFQVERSSLDGIDVRPGDLLFVPNRDMDPRRKHAEERLLDRWRNGQVDVVVLPRAEATGIHGWFTESPLFASRRNRVGRGGVFDASLERGSYLLLARQDGYADMRIPFRLGHLKTGSKQERSMRKLEQVPLGFVHVPEGEFVGGGDRGRSYQSHHKGEYGITEFFIAREEVTLGEYLEALKWFDQRYPGSVDELLPPDRVANPGWIIPWEIDPDTFEVSPAHFAELPVAGIPSSAAERFCEIQSLRAAERGESWVYELPLGLSWEKAARGVDGRIFSWGSQFDWKLAFGKWSVAPPKGLKHHWYPQLTEQWLGDESPYGVLGMTGNVEEYVHPQNGELKKLPPSVRGGGFARPDAMAFRSPRSIDEKPIPSPGTGFRLVARLKDMPEQGAVEVSRTEGAAKRTN